MFLLFFVLVKISFVSFHSLISLATVLCLLDFSESSFIVKLRGLPFSSTVEEIRAFLTPLDPTEIHLGYTASGRRAGDAYVEFRSGLLC
jgi:hypothetical protein